MKGEPRIVGDEKEMPMIIQWHVLVKMGGNMVEILQ